MNDVRAWYDDPVRFAVDVLQAPDESGRLQPFCPWSRQAEFLRAVANFDHVACKSGQKTGKTGGLAVLALWWCVTRPRSRVLLTAPSSHQIRNILWPEIRQLHTTARFPLGGELFIDPAKGCVWGDKWGIFSVTTDKPERIQGLSGARQLIMVDEASGYPEPLFGALQGNLGGGGKMVLTSNPTQTSGTFFDAFGKNRDHWERISISSLESPNFNPLLPRVPGLATPEWLTFSALEWGGEESPLYQVRALGNFPTQGSNAVVGTAIVDAAVARWETTSGEGALALGLDVARYGDDDSVIAPRRGKKIFELLKEHGKSTDQIAAWALDTAIEMRADGSKDEAGRPNETVTINVDTIGIGAGVADTLRAYEKSWLIIVDVNSSEAAFDPERFTNRRSEMAFAVADFLKEGGALPKDGALEGELVAPVYDFDPQGRRRVESKDAIKKRIRRSPDRADAVALVVTRAAPEPIPAPSPGVNPRWGNTKRGF